MVLCYLLVKLGENLSERQIHIKEQLASQFKMFILFFLKTYLWFKTGVTELIRHPSKKLRITACHIITDFLAHTTQFLALAQHQVRYT